MMVLFCLFWQLFYIIFETYGFYMILYNRIYKDNKTMIENLIKSLLYPSKPTEVSSMCLESILCQLNLLSCCLKCVSKYIYVSTRHLGTYTTVISLIRPEGSRRKKATPQTASGARI